MAWVNEMIKCLLVFTVIVLAPQERKEREARVAEGGWTVVTHHKGRKKTTDSESGIVVGSVSQAALEDKLAKKKRKEVGPDFYRFQRREAQRNGMINFSCSFISFFLETTAWVRVKLVAKTIVQASPHFYHAEHSVHQGYLS